MRISRHLAVSAATATCLAVGITPAALANAKTAHYSGKTRDGDPISFTVRGSKLSHLRAYVPTLCGTSDAGGTPLHGSGPFDPPGAFAFGHKTQRKAERENTIWNTNTVTKNFVVSVKRGRNGVIAGKLHVDYSFLMILATYPISSRPYVCTGDSAFKLTT
jgi:hypothetical protein